MSKRNKHFKSLWRNDINNRTCPKRTCPGILIHCIVTYIPHGPLCEEFECSECGLVKKYKKHGSNSKKNGQYSSQKARLLNR